VKPMTVLIIGHFSISTKFCENPWKYQNSVEKGKFCGSAQNYETHEKTVDPNHDPSTPAPSQSQLLSENQQSIAWSGQQQIMR